ncbi:PP2C family protein-serine/threonine phosphatase [Modestobacter marinus]|uniref:Potassium-transporting ATPase subunit B n=1 Tax=Modestobacter marinus TaxID=477641 RepID=A0ABQ2GB37_9ACTN|nr:SpoIIE family protein phosphatase [Modestobacter marinus]GGL83824.1 potassium-transporting ATPase subunit B [Modestobacter marinus]
MTELLHLPLGPDGDLVRVCTTVRQAAELLGLSGQDQTRLATAAAEAARATCRPGGGTLRLSVKPDTGTSGSVHVEFTPAAGPRAPRGGKTIDVLGRLLDRFEPAEDRWLLVKHLPGDQPVPAARLTIARQTLAQDADVDPVAALSEQNGELATALAQLRSREGELLRLNEELAETNRGVLALYAELERSAETIRVAQRQVFTELENALRPPPPAIPGMELGIRYLPAQSNSPTGGDLYDWLVLADGWLHITVVDVVGHGVKSTRTALDVTHAIRTLCREGHPLGDVTALADSLLAGTGALATVLLARVHPKTGTAEIAGAGHPPALLIRARGGVEYVEAKGRPIGFPGAGSYGVTHVELDPGDMLVLYTDGVIEAGPDIDEGLELLREAGLRLRDQALDDVLEGMLEAVQAGNALRDDALLLGARRIE